MKQRAHRLKWVEVGVSRGVLKWVDVHMSMCSWVCVWCVSYVVPVIYGTTYVIYGTTYVIHGTTYVIHGTTYVTYGTTYVIHGARVSHHRACAHIWARVTQVGSSRCAVPRQLCRAVRT